MTKNRRYEGYYDDLNDQKIAIAAAELTPTTLPLRAYGPEPIVWAPRTAMPTVWAWVSWRNAPASKVAATAAGWNDRIVVIEWEQTGGRRSVAVWRNAVTRRVT
ncbi:MULTISPECIES: hypothetical protein [Microbacterium]|uniref:hypothetical protein n=1 Tax=Microbacterium TaxID=33882 RepID=UPI00146A3817|nr:MULTISPECIES: hypothetical protein [Microbacterium]